LISNKVVAVYVGPAGVALLGQFSNFTSILLTVSTGGINVGVTKYISEYKNSTAKLNAILNASCKITLWFAVPLSLFLFVAHEQLAVFVFKKTEYSNLFIIFAVMLILFALNSLLMSILTGFKEVRKLTTANIVGSIIGLFLTILFTMTMGLYGALLSMIVTQGVVFFVTLYFVIGSSWWKFDFIRQKIDRQELAKLFKFSLMALTSAATIPVSQMIIRNHLGTSISWDAAGYWQAMWRLSEIYLTFVTVSFSVYYVPRLSEIFAEHDLRKEILYGFKIIMPIIGFGCLSVYVLKDFIITVLFTEKFLPMRQLFAFQLVGDFFKITSWILGNVVVAKAMTKTYIATEIFATLNLLGMTFICVHFFGLVGVTYAYTFCYICHLTIFLIIFRKLLFSSGKTSYVT